MVALPSPKSISPSAFFLMGDFSLKHYVNAFLLVDLLYQFDNVYLQKSFAWLFMLSILSCDTFLVTVVKLQEPSIEVYKESPFLLNCSTTQPDCMANLDEVYQPSPVSVLEAPFRGEKSPTPEFLGRINVDITGEWTRSSNLKYQLGLFVHAFGCFIFNLLQH